MPDSSIDADSMTVINSTVSSLIVSFTQLGMGEFLSHDISMLLATMLTILHQVV